MRFKYYPPDEWQRLEGLLDKDLKAALSIPVVGYRLTRATVQLNIRTLREANEVDDDKLLQFVGLGRVTIKKFHKAIQAALRRGISETSPLVLWADNPGHVEAALRAYAAWGGLVGHE